MPANPTLSHFVRTYEGSIDAPRCAEWIAHFNAADAARTDNGRGHRQGLDHSGWTELNVSRDAPAGWVDALRRQVPEILARYNREVGLSIPVPASTKLADFILKRYRPGGRDRFELHFDSIYEVSNRYLVLLWYLNDVDAGETVFPDLEVAISPRAGRLLVFPPYWLFQHAGEPPVGGDKYILSTYLLF